MNKKIIALLLAVLAVCAVIGLSLPSQEPNEPRSPQRVHDFRGPGSGHAFGFNIVYTIERHAVYDGEEMVVISSGAKDEENVEIWTPMPGLLSLPDGSTFRLSSEGETWDEAFEVLKLGT